MFASSRRGTHLDRMHGIYSLESSCGEGQREREGGFKWWAEVEAASYCFNEPPAFQ